ncbi:MAG TPA: DUF2309 domain-containing protein [Methylococcaceae bacterium]|nr:DUF2309 domain-containing protein [Methylococcaceae bacterium]
MSQDHAEWAEVPQDIRERLRAAVDHLDHVLPGQAPILNFVHHNTLHGYQHLRFTEALAAAEQMTGIHGYLPDEEFRALYARGRINDADLDASLDHQADRRADEILARIGERAISKREVWRIGLIHGVQAISSSRLNWQIEELNALGRFQGDVPEGARSAVLVAAQRTTPSASGERPAENRVVRELWDACLAVFDLNHLRLHPEELAELPLHQAEETLAGFEAGSADEGHSNPIAHRRMRAEAREELQTLLADVGAGLTLRGLLLALTGKDLLEEVRPIFIRFCASHLDEGLAAWHAPDRAEGLYAAWRRCAHSDFALALADLPNWRQRQAELPDHAVDAVIAGLRRLQIPEHRWEGYLKRLALELPGWSGLFNWRHHRPDYPANRESPIVLMDYLALRLFLDGLWIDRISRETWGIAGNLNDLQAYFQRNLSEFSARAALFANNLPEYLAAGAQKLIGQSWAERGHRENWRALADMIWTWTISSGTKWDAQRPERAGSKDGLRNHSPVAEKPGRHTVYRSAWRLFRLAQHLGLSGGDVRALPTEAAERLLAALDELTAAERGYLWLWAYERHYREELFTALSQNHGRGRWARRDERPEAQIIFCMDDREESIRRHLEELNPAIETLGAAGFFGVAMNWRGLDDQGVTPLCPVVVTPSHEVREEPRPGQEGASARHDRRRRIKGLLGRLFNQESRRNLLTSGLLMGALAPGVLVALAGKVFFPRRQAALSRKTASALVPAVPTRLHLSAPPGSADATPSKPRLGFTDAEQADRVTGFLRNVGLTSRFAPLVVLSGHGSISQNNPHLAAYDCGACSGRHGGPNARAFAAMANRREIRALVAERGISIPNDTWFLGSEHNTCNEDILWFDLEDLPSAFNPALERLRADLGRAVLLSAHERCRRFASAPPKPGLQQAMNHVVARSTDFSQARPELGHATNAAAVIGRRSVTQGAFFDRRVFLISYDPTQDPEGRILEGILLAVGPVGAGINLEYYFSTVNNERFGCGSKVPHNVTGLCAVMEGAMSDLRTGLPLQMIEIHEAMRLQVVVEATEAVLAGIYRRQPPLRELIGNGWLLLSAIHPETGAISVFEPARGFVPWSGGLGPLPVVERSTDWYDGHSEPRPPALIRQPLIREVRHAG